MPYCVSTLHTDILPQNESRRCAMPIFFVSSPQAWTSTGTSRPASRSVSADGALVAEVRQRDDHAGDLAAVRLEQFRALLRVGAGLHGAVSGLAWAEDDHVVSGVREARRHLFAAAAGEMAGEESAAAHEQPEGQFSRRAVGGGTASVCLGGFGRGLGLDLMEGHAMR